MAGSMSEPLMQALAFVPPSWLLAALLALLNVFVFRVAVGRDAYSALYFLPWGAIGFALGNLVAVVARSPVPSLGDVHVVEASLGAWAALTLGNLRVPAAE
jgi:hypothetical protein